MNSSKYRHPKETCSLDTWNKWFENENIRLHVISTIDYNCFWRKRNRIMLFRILNDWPWNIRHDDYFDQDYDYFNLNNLFFETDGDIWKTYYDESSEDLFSLNLLFRNFTIRPECDDCCINDYGPFDSDYDLCNFCYCCRYLQKFHDDQTSKTL
ncbi:PREDICTED: uncharacterized protein LOC105360680 [Ceratosolen solmsi marchali]|uniref:Uncharacterized protein LOC105360680 n=1 Tax=Ceratosolen solmsi marchali TaxID=326594 RepID=A0AAJ6YDB0_9HYME|nr:PREDICTED: uncharacterized protein LOC105360680 [Ceratosolen solmsi marchali]